MPESIHRLVENWRKVRKKTASKPTEAEGYEVAAQYHEHLVAKYCALLGTTLAGVVSFEDRRGALFTIPSGCQERSGRMHRSIWRRMPRCFASGDV